MDLSQFNIHGFRMGVATSAGISDSHLKALGRWQSDAYEKYVRLSPQDLASCQNLLFCLLTRKKPNQVQCCLKKVKAFP